LSLGAAGASALIGIWLSVDGVRDSRPDGVRVIAGVAMFACAGLAVVVLVFALIIPW
jgi:hypothetical protein